jgi:hypothetical protein
MRTQPVMTVAAQNDPRLMAPTSCEALRPIHVDRRRREIRGVVQLAYHVALGIQHVGRVRHHRITPQTFHVGFAAECHYAQHDRKARVRRNLTSLRAWNEDEASVSLSAPRQSVHQCRDANEHHLVRALEFRFVTADAS